METTDIRIESARDGAIARIIVDKPKGNVHTGAVMAAIQERVSAAQDDAALKLITIEGAGKHFSFGASVEEHVAEQAADMLATFRGLIMTVAGSGVPVAALVQGCCYGGAFELVLACHFIFAAPDSRMALPEIKLGVFPPPACALLPRKLGQAVADRVVLTGEDLTGEELHRYGLVHKLFPAEELFAGVEAWFSETLGTCSASSLRHASRASRALFMRGLETDLQELEKTYLESLMKTEDANEGIAAFIDRRKPEWRNA